MSKDAFEGLKVKLFANLSDEAKASYLFQCGTDKLEKEAKEGLTREQQLEKALRTALGMLNAYMTEQERANNMTLSYLKQLYEKGPKA